MIVDCARIASSSVRQRRSARTDFSSVHGFAKSCATQATSKAARCARQPRPICSDAQHPYKLNAILQVNRAQGEGEADIPETYYEMRRQ
jgi:hypothetical protein